MENKKKKSPLLYIGIICTVVIAIIVAIILVLLNLNKDGEKKQIETFLEETFENLYINKVPDEIANSYYPTLDDGEQDALNQDIDNTVETLGNIMDVKVDITGVKEVSELYDNDSSSLENINALKEKAGINKLYVYEGKIIIKGTKDDYVINATYYYSSNILGKINGEWKILNVTNILYGKYLGDDSASTDRKNADAINSSIRNCITDYEIENEELLKEGDTMTVEWDSSGLKSTGNMIFDGILEENIDVSITNSAVDSNKYAKAVISKSNENGSYEISVSWE